MKIQLKWGWWVTAFCVLQPSSASFADVDFQNRISRLRDSQKRLDSQMNQFGFKAGVIGTGSGAQDSSEETKKAPLFQIHGELLSQRLPAGKLLFGRVYTRLVVGPEGSPALVELSDNQGGLSRLRFMGMARQSGTEGRLNIELTKLLCLGHAISVQGIALDSAGAFGLEAQVLSGKAWAVAGAMASSFISGLAASQQSQTTNAFGFNQTQTTGRNAMLQGVAQTAADQSKRLIEEATTEKPVLIVEADTPLTVLIQEEVKF